MNPEYLVPMEWSVVSECEAVGPYSSEDYGTALLNLKAPLSSAVWKGLQNPPSGQRVVIVGARSIPGVLVRAVFLALLTRPESIDVKVATPDEMILLKAFLATHTWIPKELRRAVSLYSFSHQEPPREWDQAVQAATRVVVYGGEEAITHYRDQISPQAKMIEFGPKFSLQVLDQHRSNPVEWRARKVAFDFTLYGGSGCMSPWVSLVLEDTWRESLIPKLTTGWTAALDSLTKFWRKLPPVDSLKVNEMMGENILSESGSPYFSVQRGLPEPETLGPLYGLGRFHIVSQLEVDQFLETHRDQLSTLGHLGLVPRHSWTERILMTTSVGSMQTPPVDHFHEGVDEMSELR